MARKPRAGVAGVPQHVIQRGNNRQPCFFDGSDYVEYLEALTDAAERHGCAVHAYVLMTNHVHLLATPERADGISKLMQSVGRRYVRYVNHAYRRTGTLWEGRFKSSLIESERYLLTCQRYIELNPVRAGMVVAPSEYRWSSYRHNAYGKPNKLVRHHGEYLALGADEERRRAAYRELFRSALDSEQVHELTELALTGQITGSSRFAEDIERTLGRSIRKGKPGRPAKEKVL